MKRTINFKAIITIACIPVGLLLTWLIGVGVWEFGGKNNPALWVEIHNQSFLNNLANGFLMLFCLEIIVLIAIVIGYGIHKLFNWIFPKSNERSRGN